MNTSKEAHMGPKENIWDLYPSAEDPCIFGILCW